VGEWEGSSEIQASPEPLSYQGSGQEKTEEVMPGGSQAPVTMAAQKRPRTLLTHPEFGPLAEITTDGARRWWVIQSRGCKLVVFWTVASRFGWEYVINQRKQNLPVHIFNIGRGQVTVGQVGLGLPSLTTFPVLWGGESSQAVTVPLTLGQWPVLQCWIS
jgi:hypothetical protein